MVDRAIAACQLAFRDAFLVLLASESGFENAECGATVAIDARSVVALFVLVGVEMSVTAKRRALAFAFAVDRFASPVGFHGAIRRTTVAVVVVLIIASFVIRLNDAVAAVVLAFAFAGAAVVFSGCVLTLCVAFLAIADVDVIEFTVAAVMRPFTGCGACPKAVLGREIAIVACFFGVIYLAVAAMGQIGAGAAFGRTSPVRIHGGAVGVAAVVGDVVAVVARLVVFDDAVAASDDPGACAARGGTIPVFFDGGAVGVAAVSVLVVAVVADFRALDDAVAASDDPGTCAARGGAVPVFFDGGAVGVAAVSVLVVAIVACLVALDDAVAALGFEGAGTTRGGAFPAVVDGGAVGVAAVSVLVVAIVADLVALDDAVAASRHDDRILGIVGTARDDEAKQTDPKRFPTHGTSYTKNAIRRIA